MPDLLDRSRDLTRLDGIEAEYMGRWTLERWPGHESCLTLSNANPENRFINVHFSDAGCLILGHDVDIGGLDEGDFKGSLAAHVPPALLGCCRGCPTLHEFTFFYLSFVMWRTPDDDTWQLMHVYEIEDEANNAWYDALDDVPEEDDPDSQVFELLSDLCNE
ncbi:hypothetical protein ACFZAV_38930 [Streptomyces sp. NPDC008343]|uniref:hypothetical protein n=1 Tax=Streptomyces sp. NPDC008343 TaxID=3364828 RepID=UPI0036E0825C